MSFQCSVSVLLKLILNSNSSINDGMMYMEAKERERERTVCVLKAFEFVLFQNILKTTI